MGERGKYIDIRDRDRQQLVVNQSAIQFTNTTSCHHAHPTAVIRKPTNTEWAESSLARCVIDIYTTMQSANGIRHQRNIVPGLYRHPVFCGVRKIFAGPFRGS